MLTYGWTEKGMLILFPTAFGCVFLFFFFENNTNVYILDFVGDFRRGEMLRDLVLRQSWSLLCIE